MRVFFSRLGLFFLVWLGIVSCESENKLEYYYSMDKQKVVTRLSSEGRVYFIHGFYDQLKPPLAYITPVSGMDHAYTCYIYWDRNNAYLLTYYGKWATIGNPKNFFHRHIEDNGQVNEITADKSGKYVLSIGDIHP